MTVELNRSETGEIVCYIRNVPTNLQADDVALIHYAIEDALFEVVVELSGNSCPRGSQPKRMW
jgi:hypothetical protein